MEDWFECLRCHKRFSSEVHGEIVEEMKCPCGGKLLDTCPQCRKSECVCMEAPVEGF